MKAYEIRDAFGVDALAVSERPEPQPGPGQVVVMNRAVSLNFRDLLVVKGDYSRKLPLPMTPCSDCAGEVAAVGEGVTRVKRGDRVAGIFMQTWLDGEVTEAKAKSALGGAISGVLAESVLLHENGLVPIPSHLSFEEAATLPCAGVTAWHALIAEQAVKPGDTVVTLGSGGVSLFALQFAKMAGARVISTSGSDEKLAKLRGLGAAEGINYKTAPEWDKRVRELTGAGADHIVEVGGASTLPKSLKAVRMGGRISLIGNVAGGGEVNPVPLLMKNVRMQGIFVGSREMFENMNRAISAHGLRPVVDRVFGFDQAREAMHYMESGAHFGKICIRVS
ncbi:MAG TPA: NAD(P)-dependent alcohol dehydrogenase [Bryobacteraceae bacterium]|jgi:NADPH:quinone reductase-like Zn-dependent oxidoreductase|nr:NAD(P)-dependent alcohol dehydrogenase [Bryobacteraceae bacterium]